MKVKAMNRIWWWERRKLQMITTIVSNLIDEWENVDVF